MINMSFHTAGNLRAEFKQYLETGRCQPLFVSLFGGVKRFTDERVAQAENIDYTIVAEALMRWRTSPDVLRQFAGHVGTYLRRI